MTDTPHNAPTFEGLVLHENANWRFHFWYPKGWHAHQLSDGRIGILCSPMAEDPTTFFSVEVIPLSVQVQADDLDLLCEGVQEGLGQLPGLHVESAEESVAGGQITIERTYTFQDGDVTRQRRIRLIYAHDRLYSLMSQGSTVEEYAYWLPMLNYCYLTFQLGLFDLASLSQSADR